MAVVTHRGKPVRTVGDLPKVGEPAPDFVLVRDDLSDVRLANFKGRKLIINIFPSIDTPICAASVKKFNLEVQKLDNIAVLCVSRDLPFAQKRFRGVEGIDVAITASDFRDLTFSDRYGVRITAGPLAGLLARAVVVVDEAGKVIYTEQVADLGKEPQYKNVLNAVTDGAVKK